MSAHSPTITVFEKAKMPGKETLRYGRIRTGEGSITCLRKPWKLPGPALPASMKVVTPPVRASSSASTPKDVPPQ